MPFPPPPASISQRVFMSFYVCRSYSSTSKAFCLPSEKDLSNLCYRKWDGEACERRATLESILSNLCYRWWDYCHYVFYFVYCHRFVICFSAKIDIFFFVNAIRKWDFYKMHSQRRMWGGSQVLSLSRRSARQPSPFWHA